MVETVWNECNCFGSEWSRLSLSNVSWDQTIRTAHFQTLPNVCHSSFFTLSSDRYGHQRLFPFCNCEKETWHKSTNLVIRPRDYAFPFIYFLSDYNSVNYQPVLPVGLSFHQLPNGSLSIVSISKESEGAYTCTAQNGIRTSLTKTINISVNGRKIPPLLCTVSFIYRSFACFL